MKSKNTKGHWPKGKPRNDGDGAQLGELLVIARKRRLLKHVATQLGVARSTVFRWLDGDVPPQRTVDRLARLLG